MRIAIIIQIEEDMHTNKIMYKTIDTIIEWQSDDETIETKIMNKYPCLGYIEHCENKIIEVNVGEYKEKYLLTSIFL